MKRVLLIVVFLLSIVTVNAQLQIGTPGSNGLIPHISVSSNRVGGITTLTVQNIAPQAQSVYLFVGTNPWREDFSSSFGPGAWLMVRPDPIPNRFLIFNLGRAGTFSFPVVPGFPAIIYLQAVVIDAGGRGGIALSPPYQFTPARSDMTEIHSGLFLKDIRRNAGKFIDPDTGIMYVFGGENITVREKRDVIEINPHAPLSSKTKSFNNELPYCLSQIQPVWDSRLKKAYFLGGGSARLNQPVECNYPAGYNRDALLEFDPYQPVGSRFRILEDRVPLIGGTGPGYLNDVLYDETSGQAYAFAMYYTASGNYARVLRFTPSGVPGQRIEILPFEPPFQTLWPAGSTLDPRTRKIYLMTYYSQPPSLYEFTLGGPQGMAMTGVYPIAIPDSPLYNYYSRLWDLSLVFHERLGKLLLIGGLFHASIPVIHASNAVYAADPTTFVPGQPATFTTFSTIPFTNNGAGGYGGYGFYDKLLDDVFFITNYETAGPIAPYASGPSGTLYKLNPTTRVTKPLFKIPSIYRTAVMRNPLTQVSYLIGGLIDGASTDSIIRFYERGLQPTETFSGLIPEIFSHSATWDTTTNAGYIFGGSPVSGSFYDTVFSLIDGPQGLRVELQPERLPIGAITMASATDPRTRKMYLFGGRSYLSGTIATMVEWNPLAPRGSRLRTLGTTLPQPLAGAAAAWNPQENAFYIFGGYTQSQALRQILKFFPDQERVEISQDLLPEGLVGHGAAYYPSTGTFFIFGESRDFLEYNPVTHTFRNAGPLPPDGRFEFGLARDSELSRSFLFGGYAWSTAGLDSVIVHSGGS